ncbi:MAG: hypothetical protein ACI8P0_001743 [Planctomycetaceae bacterium]|jgi:hypothetical protein
MTAGDYLLQGKPSLFSTIQRTSPPNLLNSQIEQLALELNIDDFEFHHTHWAVKDVDLFEILFGNIQARRATPRVFDISDPEIIEPDLVAVMMPFKSDFDAVYAAINDACLKVDLRCFRADDIWEAATIIQDVVSLIDRAGVVICDCTEQNANVFYEAGIAHTLGREVILVTQSESDIPFDLRHFRQIRYLKNAEGLDSLCESLRKRLIHLTQSD